MKIKQAVCSVVVAIPMALAAQPSPPVVHLWANGAPGFESRKDIPEQAASYWVKDVNNPSVTVFLPPKEKATGAAVIVWRVRDLRIVLAEYPRSAVRRIVARPRLPAMRARDPRAKCSESAPGAGRLFGRR